MFTGPRPSRFPAAWGLVLQWLRASTTMALVNVRGPMSLVTQLSGTVYYSQRLELEQDALSVAVPSAFALLKDKAPVFYEQRSLSLQSK
jgi:hypothetical protein